MRRLLARAAGNCAISIGQCGAYGSTAVYSGSNMVISLSQRILSVLTIVVIFVKLTELDDETSVGFSWHTSCQPFRRFAPALEDVFQYRREE